MGHNSGVLTQKFEIELDIDKLVDFISEKIIKAIEEEKDKKGRCIFSDVELDECYTDDGKICIKGTYDTAYESWYSPETRYEPSEYEEERSCISDTDGEWMLCVLPENIRELIKVWSVKEDGEDVDYHYQEPEEPEYWYEDR